MNEDAGANLFPFFMNISFHILTFGVNKIHKPCSTATFDHIFFLIHCNYKSLIKELLF